ncbi:MULTISPECIES: hypothetical protein [unclassified Microcoleus]|uniref:hypothetical protein n=1 Tax=unclassified Microcoleus TaxID=2642155 RepID=UPI002FD5CCFA
MSRLPGVISCICLLVWCCLHRIKFADRAIGVISIEDTAKYFVVSQKFAVADGSAEAK